MAISPQRLTIYLYSAHRAVVFAIAQLSCFISVLFHHVRRALDSVSVAVWRVIMVVLQLCVNILRDVNLLIANKVANVPSKLVINTSVLHVES